GRRCVESSAVLERTLNWNLMDGIYELIAPYGTNAETTELIAVISRFDRYDCLEIGANLARLQSVSATLEYCRDLTASGLSRQSARRRLDRPLPWFTSLTSRLGPVFDLLLG